MRKNHQEIEDELLPVQENMNTTTKEDDENILQEDMEISDANSEDFCQETDLILTQKEIVHDQESSEDETVEHCVFSKSI